MSYLQNRRQYKLEISPEEIFVDRMFVELFNDVVLIDGDQIRKKIADCGDQRRR